MRTEWCDLRATERCEDSGACMHSANAGLGRQKSPWSMEQMKQERHASRAKPGVQPIVLCTCKRRRCGSLVRAWSRCRRGSSVRAFCRRRCGSFVGAWSPCSAGARPGKQNLLRQRPFPHPFPLPALHRGNLEGAHAQHRPLHSVSETPAGILPPTCALHTLPSPHPATLPVRQGRLKRRVLATAAAPGSVRPSTHAEPAATRCVLGSASTLWCAVITCVEPRGRGACTRGRCGVPCAQQVWRATCGNAITAGALCGDGRGAPQPQEPPRQAGGGISTMYESHMMESRCGRPRRDRGRAGRTGQRRRRERAGDVRRGPYAHKEARSGKSRTQRGVKDSGSRGVSGVGGAQ
mmetsp:Transcript_26944/g.79942  ORF Transcript_26944/g.79942 Transcript_26944/m.79942 type:complete len:350 (+) Transcript_26944:140-1189(+)|eukprot:364532-Chlamydomonas_euryale.AAC.2